MLQHGVSIVPKRNNRLIDKLLAYQLIVGMQASALHTTIDETPLSFRTL
ncbi:hypothetical protein POY03_20945 [Enterobacter ludwigii]